MSPLAWPPGGRATLGAADRARERAVNEVEDPPGRAAEVARPAPTWWLTRFLILRLLGLVYAFAFLSLATQVLPLIGSHGLLPASAFLERVA
jgi:hypothetical protein